jgi:phosphatidylglycerol---prolipoprotein diacylglyceryl transferase
LIPYIHIASYKLLGLLPIQPFGVLVGLALILGYTLGQRRARLTGLDPRICADGMVWVVVSGFVIAHLVSVIFYFPQRILEKPWILLAVWAGLSSFGGFVGGALGAYVYFRRQGVSIIKYADAILFGLIPAWILGRMGCTVVHDHPGLPTTFWLAVKYPTDLAHYTWANFFHGVGSYEGIVRHDLGFYEMLFAILLTLVLYSLKNVRPFDGFHPAVMLLLYSPVRFMFDYLRIEDATYIGLTPGQFFAVGMMALALFLIFRGLKQKRIDGNPPQEEKSSSKSKAKVKAKAG